MPLDVRIFEGVAVEVNAFPCHMIRNFKAAVDDMQTTNVLFFYFFKNIFVPFLFVVSSHSLAQRFEGQT